jgi:hypothetical protein
MIRWVGAGIAIVLAMLLYPMPRTNPPVEEEIPAPDAVREVLRRSCYDCHSNETRWPWYAYVPPVKFFVVYDVDEGRRHMNFSTWNNFGAKKRDKRLREIMEEIDEAEMPLPSYLRLHPDAELSADDKELLRIWSEGSLAR